MSSFLGKDTIGANCVPDCMLCGNAGKTLYSGMKDWLFGVPGEWTLKKCSNDQCGLVWLDPMPVEADISRAYQTYYTHSSGMGLMGIESTFFTKAVIRCLNVLAFPLSINLRRERKQASMAYLGGVKAGSLLEVGCGDGGYLSRMRFLGWKVEGLEVDTKAAQAARKTYDLNVHEGTMEQANLVESNYDAVVLRHVIEHVHDPVSLLKECFRVLKPGGTLRVITPNIQSLAHRRFGQDWRGLEPPRHLHLFSSETLTAVAYKAGFMDVYARSTPVQAESIFISSQRILSHRTRLLQGDTPLASYFAFKAICFQFLEQLYYLYDCECGEEVVMQGTK